MQTPMHVQTPAIEDRNIPSHKLLQSYADEQEEVRLDHDGTRDPSRKWTLIDYKRIPYAAVTSFRFTNFRPLPSDHRSAIPAHRYAYLFTRATSKGSHYAREISSTSSPRQLSVDYYAKTCPQLEQLVGSVTSQQFKEAPVSGPATIRLFFHDCFVQGCDASILISTTPGSEVLAEKDAEDNQDLRVEGFQTISKAKALVESKCPGVVSSADILAIAARDYVHLAGGPYYQVKKGRWDGKISMASRVPYNIPRANFTQFVSRLYNYRGSKQPDPDMDPRLLKALRMSCPQFGGNSDTVAPFDVTTPFVFDHAYYGNLEAKLGLLASDQALFLDPRTKPLVLQLGTDKHKFFQAFAAAMEKMGSIGVERGT
ncbi:hypothetical protein POTOM_039507 [Populus tomentosa]|uniref:peroxidase n=1 Tax=Populus tomentosa TaxID=118781 RepID=A0A8X7YUV1_POPTO|nr:hypothetical protein POTOM_039507 [Populus tomentosa]